VGLYLIMKQIILAVWLSAFTLMGRLVAEEAADWKSIHLFQGFHYTHFEESPVLSEEEHRMVSALQYISSPASHQILLKEKGEYFAFNVCDLNFWKWEGDVWIKKTTSGVLGYNCTPYFFLLDSQPFSISGSGYWQNQADLFRLNASTGKVEFVPTVDQPENFRGHVYFQTDEGIVTLFGHQFDARLDVYELNKGGFFLDLATSTWQKLNVEWFAPVDQEFEYLDFGQVNDIFSQVETDTYAVLELHQRDAKKSYWLIIDKRDLSIYIKEIPFLQITDSKWIQVMGDTVVHLGRNSSKTATIPISRIMESSKLVGKVVFHTPSFRERYLDGFYLVLVIFPLLMMILGGWWIGWKRKRNSVVDEFEQEFLDEPASGKQVVSWLGRIRPFSGKMIDQDQMDSIFELSEIKNSDLRKVKRSRAIKAVNEFLLEQDRPPAIIRVRDAQDKRVIRYRIELVPFSNYKKQPVKIS